MPELVPTYERLVELAGGGDLAARLLRSTARRASSSAARRAPGRAARRCWCATTTTRSSRLEGIVYLTAWTGRRVLGMSDCLWGLLDGVNDAGLARLADVRRAAATSATASRIPLVVRYLLETCDDVAEARAALARIPVHAAQNLTLLDRSGDLRDRLRRDRAARARVPRDRGDDQPPGQGGVAGVRGARSAPSSASAACSTCSATRSSTRERFMARSSSRRCAARSTRRASGRSTPPPTTRSGGPRRVPLARRRVGAVVRRLRRVPRR